MRNGCLLAEGPPDAVMKQHSATVSAHGMSGRALELVVRAGRQLMAARSRIAHFIINNGDFIFSSFALKF